MNIKTLLAEVNELVDVIGSDDIITIEIDTVNLWETTAKIHVTEDIFDSIWGYESAQVLDSHKGKYVGLETMVGNVQIICLVDGKGE